MADIGPKLLQQIRYSIYSYLRSPILRCLAKRALRCRVVEIGNARPREVSRDFREIKSVAAGICLRDEKTADGITRPVHEASTTESVVARILVCNHGNNSFREVIPDCFIRKRMPVIATISWESIMKLGR